MLRNVIDHIRNLFVGYKCSLYTDRLRNPLWIKQHIAFSQKLFGAIHIEDRAGIDAGSYRKSDTARHIRLDQSGNNID